MQGAKKDGAAGAIKGLSKGIGGLILKPASGKFCKKIIDVEEILF